ncbi:putative mitochondrial protein AtMg00820 [Bidens hawaiensis]|uniref:putative mitochondrial protein AtMg00820 n=1 Tax=Bidens hawaiensis TaxID=980011 RepID=UPI00404B62D1
MKGCHAAEYNALMKDGTWTLVPSVKNANVVDCKWVYRIKRDQHGAITRYKARLVAKGFNKQAGIDYNETFSPVVKATTPRGTLLYMLVYVDDIILTANSPTAIDRIVQHLSTTFALQDMGALSYFLGIEVNSKGPNILLS